MARSIRVIVAALVVAMLGLAGASIAGARHTAYIEASNPHCGPCPHDRS